MRNFAEPFGLSTSSEAGNGASPAGDSVTSQHSDEQSSLSAFLADSAESGDTALTEDEREALERPLGDSLRGLMWGLFLWLLVVTIGFAATQLYL